MNNVFVVFVPSFKKAFGTISPINSMQMCEQTFIAPPYAIACIVAYCFYALLCIPNLAAQSLPSALPTALPAAQPTAIPTRESLHLEQVLEFLARESNINPSVDALEYFGTHPVRLANVPVRTLQTLPGISTETALAIVRFVHRRRRQTKRTPTIEAIRDSLRLSDAQAFVLAFCTIADDDESATVAEDTAPVSGRPIERERTTVTTPSAQSAQSAQSNLGAVPVVQVPLSAWYRARTRFWAVPQRGLTPEATSAQQFQGSALDLYQRLSVRLDADDATIYEANCTAAKDAGERSLVDFLSGYARVEFGSKSSNEFDDESLNASHVRTSIIAGDYLVQSGMGTGLWQMFGSKKGADVISPVTQTATGITPYRSSTEQQFFRGVAVSSLWRLDPARTLLVMGWASSQQRAATIDTLRNVATSLDLDGLFRTRTEISKEARLLEQAVGASVEVQVQKNINAPALTLGASAMWLGYDKAITSRSVQVFPQQNGILTTLHGMLTADAFVLVAECMRDGAGNIGGRIGAETHAFAAWELAATVRAFGTEFRSPFGMNFGENTKPSNEAGVYIGAVWKGVGGLRVNSYFDLYTTLSSTSTVAALVRGVDVFSEGVWQATPALQLTARLRHETKTDAMTITTGTGSGSGSSSGTGSGTSSGTSKAQQKVIFGRSKSSIRLHGAWSVSDALTVQARTEAVLVGFEQYAPAETGVLVFVGCRYSPVPQLGVTARLVGFSTDSFDSALWQYESTIAGTLSNPPLYGKGIRAYMMLDIQPWNALQFTLRGSLTRRFDVVTFSSGATQINSNTDAQLVVQVEVRL
jgi:hypothetical protein